VTFGRIAIVTKEILRLTDLPNIDEIDMKLLALLQKDARQSNKDLAAEVGIAQSTCLERIRRLKESGVILGWHAEVDLAAIGRPIRAMVSVRLQPKTTKSVRDFQRDVIEAPETLAVSMVSGDDDFIIEIAAADIDALREYFLTHIAGRRDVADTSTSIIFEQTRVLPLRSLESTR
jgi:DNA-binding Lrp family transcriptional regulator